MDFLDKFKQAEYEFTYGAEEDSEHHNALQVGLVATFYLDKGYRRESRMRIAEAYQLYHNEFGSELKWGYNNDISRARDYRTVSKTGFLNNVKNSVDDICHFRWCSDKGFLYASDYLVECGSHAKWYEEMHSPVTYFGFYLPVSMLKQKEHLIDLLFQFCTILHPVHGVMGLGIQQCHEKERYQHLEYKIGQAFPGVDITNAKTDKHSWQGIRSVNWFTFFNNQWLNKLGGMAYLRNTLHHPAIGIVPYNDGVIIRAGEWPELGWVKDNPCPELYVNVNNVLKPVRAAQIGSLGDGSVDGEVCFDDHSTARWLARFDVELKTKVCAE